MCEAGNGNRGEFRDELWNGTWMSEVTLFVCIYADDVVNEKAIRIKIEQNKQ